MNILFITPSIPSRLHRIRSCILIRALAKYHHIFLLSLTHDPIVKIPQEIKDICVRTDIVYKSKKRSFVDCLLWFWQPSEVAYCRSKEMEKKVKELVEKHTIDLVYIKRLRSAQFARGVSQSTVLDTTDAMSLFYKKMFFRGEWYKKPFYLFEYCRYLIYELRQAHVHKNWVACSQQDIDYLKKRVPMSTNISLVPNVIDTDYYKPISLPAQEKQLMFSGIMGKWVNIEAALLLVQSILPEIKRVIPDIKLSIIGPNPTARVMRLASQSVIITGYVPDIRMEIAQACIVVCPVKTATGTRNKILQAMALERPVVATTEGVQGLGAKHGEHIMVADTPEDFAKVVIQLLNDKAARDKLARNGRDYVLKNYSIKPLMESLDKVLEYRR